MYVDFASKDKDAQIIDENNRISTKENTDNLEEILKKENLIEKMELEIKKLEEANDYKNSENVSSLYPLVLFVFTPIILSAITLHYIEGWQSFLRMAALSNNILEYFIPLGLTMLLVAPIPGIGYTVSNFLINIKKRKNQKAREIKLNYLKKEIKKQKEILEKLEQDKTLSQENKIFRIVKINDLDQMKSLKSSLELCQQIAFNEKKLYKSYTDNKLDKYYNGEELDLATEYFEEKGPVLSKRILLKK